MKDDKRPGDDRPRRMRGRAGRSEVIAKVPKTGVLVVRDAATGRIFLKADDDLRPRSARIYTNWDRLRLHESLGPDDTILEHRGEHLSEVYHADDDPSDWGQTFVYTVTEYSVDDNGGVAAKTLFSQDINLANCPLDDDGLYGFGYGVNLLQDEWVERQEG